MKIRDWPWLSSLAFALVFAGGWLFSAAFLTGHGKSASEVLAVGIASGIGYMVGRLHEEDLLP